MYIHHDCVEEKNIIWLLNSIYSLDWNLSCFPFAFAYSSVNQSINPFQKSQPFAISETPLVIRPLEWRNVSRLESHIFAYSKNKLSSVSLSLTCKDSPNRTFGAFYVDTDYQCLRLSPSSEELPNDLSSWYAFYFLPKVDWLPRAFLTTLMSVRFLYWW